MAKVNSEQPVQATSEPILTARFQVSHISNYPGGQLVRLNAYDDLDNVNKAFATGSPVGHLELDITNEEAFGKFESGKSYTLTFTPDELKVTPLT
ncbi:hypothetical protein ACO2Q8_07925 [Larkinella sp. VNQ87]|uniref:hypothetical protein n=1 Tax=Larkinella sp. VNQ87 TaxID=3400921 RepID=UPI003C0E54BA